jgi:UDP-GlcNAc:undecaprenyl-phosphate GlcNAc-1-phosphate transferase
MFIKITNSIATHLDLIDKPNERKHHNGEIPLTGGIAIYLSILTISILFLPDSIEHRAYLIAAAMMVFIGAVDDKYDVSVRIRILGQLLIASIMIFAVDIDIHNLGNLLSFGDIDLLWLTIPFTFLAVLTAINAFNMVDGIDGLVGSLSINTFMSITILTLLSGNSQNAIYTLVISICIISYLFFNLAKPTSRLQKIFMGDAGSMLIGLTIVWCLATSTQGPQTSFRPVTALWIIAVPLIDMLAIIFRRIKKKQNPFKPDRDHLHHIFMRIGYTDRGALVIISVIATVFSAFGILGEILEISEVFMFSLFLIVLFAYSFAIQHVWKIITFFNLSKNHYQIKE